MGDINNKHVLVGDEREQSNGGEMKERCGR